MLGGSLLSCGIPLDRSALAAVPWIEVMAELKKFDMEHVLPMNCSGNNFTDLAKVEMPEKLIACATGSSYTFTA